MSRKAQVTTMSDPDTAMTQPTNVDTEPLAGSDERAPHTRPDAVVAYPQGYMDPPQHPPQDPSRRRKVRTYRVLNEREVSDHGDRVNMKPGKEINDLNYEIKSLQRQGVLLEEITDDEPNSPFRQH